MIERGGKKRGTQASQAKAKAKKKWRNTYFFGAVHSFLHFSGTRGAPRAPKRPNLARTAKAKQHKARDAPEKARAHQGEA